MEYRNAMEINYVNLALSASVLALAGGLALAETTITRESSTGRSVVTNPSSSGIGPRRPAQRRWLAEGISRRRKQRARQAAAVACACATLEREEAFVATLTRDLARCAALERETMAILAELTALTAGGSSQAMV
jgi:hypothetical protein